MVAIFGYICYQVIANQRYLKTESPGGGTIFYINYYFKYNKNYFNTKI